MLNCRDWIDFPPFASANRVSWHHVPFCFKRFNCEPFRVFLGTSFRVKGTMDYSGARACLSLFGVHDFGNCGGVVAGVVAVQTRTYFGRCYEEYPKGKFLMAY